MTSREGFLLCCPACGGPVALTDSTCPACHAALPPATNERLHAGLRTDARDALGVAAEPPPGPETVGHSWLAFVLLASACVPAFGSTREGRCA